MISKTQNRIIQKRKINLWCYGKQKVNSQLVQQPVLQKDTASKTGVSSKSKSQSKSVYIPPLPDGFMGARIAAHDLARYQKGEAICAYICNSNDIIGKHHWIWYDFKTSQPRCELTPPPADRYIPDVFRQHAASSQVSSTSQSKGAGITLTSPSFRCEVQDDQGFGIGSSGISDDFKLWLNRHPGLSIDEALRRYLEEQKQRSRVRLKH